MEFTVQITHNLNAPRVSHACHTRVTRVAWVVLWLQTRVYIEKHTRVHAHIVFIHACVFTHAWCLCTHSYLANVVSYCYN